MDVGVQKHAQQSGVARRLSNVEVEAIR